MKIGPQGYFAVWTQPDFGSCLTLGELVKTTYTPKRNTVSPYSSVINLFDYKANNGDEWNEKDGNINQGINVGHYLKFGEPSQNHQAVRGQANKWTGAGNGALLNICQKTLDENGYPKLSGHETIVDGNTESLAYLFNKTENENKKVYSNVKNLLSVDNEGYFYYDSSKNYAYFNEETNKFTVYDNWAVSYNNGNEGEFFPFNNISDDVNQTTLANSELNHFFGVSITSRFFHGHEGYTDSKHTKATTFEFAGDDDVWIYLDGVLLADLGGIKDSTSVTIDFAKGNIEISNVYGETGKYIKTFSELLEGTGINLATYNGNTTLENGTFHTLKFFYLERGAAASNLKIKYNLTEIPPINLFKVNQYGESLSDAKFAVYAADENKNYLTNLGGEIVSGSLKDGKFEIAENGDITVDGKTSKALYVATTDQDGYISFLNEDNMPLTLPEIQDLFGKQFILREIDVPDGHRPLIDEIHLCIENNMLQCLDEYESGVLTSPNAMVTASNTLYIAKESSLVAEAIAKGNNDILYDEVNEQYKVDKFYDIDDYKKDEKGTLFAVILKRNGRDSDITEFDKLNLNTWDPLYGTDIEGYNVLKYDGPNAQYDSQIEAVIAAAKAQSANENVIFQKEASGMQLTLYDFPGKFSRYYSYMFDDENSEGTATDPQFVVAYYWTTAKNLDDATEDNTVRIASHSNTAQGNAFNVSWGSTIEITNMENRVFFQKRKSDAEGRELIDDAIFALYSVGTEKVGEKEVVYYTANDNLHTKIYLEVDDDLKFTGKAGLSPDNMNGTYTINTSSTIKEGGMIKDIGAGNIEVTLENGNKYTIEPAVDPIKKSKYVGYTHSAESCDYVKEDGTGHFTLVNQGYYIMREIKAPKGYRVNDVEIKIVANNTGVFANAGIENDGLTVANGAGYLIKIFNQFAVEGKIDESLTWMYETLVVKGGTSFETVGIDKTNLSEWSYAKKADGDRIGYGTGKTNNISDAMVTYLKYSNGEENTLFDYSANTDLGGQDARDATQDNNVTYPETKEGEGTKRLGTESGWSTTQLYQDYSYGYSKSLENVETFYEDHRDAGNLAHLFSGSTFIEVVDDYTVDVNVIKTDDGKGTATKYLDGAQFVLYKLDDENEKIYYKKGDNGTVSWVKNDIEAYKFETQTSTDQDAKSYFKIADLSDGHYYLEEIKSPDNYLILAEPVEFVIDYEQDQENNVTGYGLIADEKYNPEDITNKVNDPYYDADSNALQYKLTIVNKNRGVDVEVNKFGRYYEDGELTDPVELSGAEFILYYIENKDGEEVKYYYSTADEYVGSVWKEDISEAHTFVCENDGNSFIINNLQSGTYYLEETVVPKTFTPPLYKTVITVNLESEENTVTVEKSGDDTVVVKGILNEDGENKKLYSINVINIAGYELPNTGGNGNNLIYTIGVMLCLVGIVGYTYVRFH